jgi:hypothetical protein
MQGTTPPANALDKFLASSLRGTSDYYTRAPLSTLRLIADRGSSSASSSSSSSSSSGHSGEGSSGGDGQGRAACTVTHASGTSTHYLVDEVAILIGATPDLSFLPELDEHSFLPQLDAASELLADSSHNAGHGGGSSGEVRADDSSARVEEGAEAGVEVCVQNASTVGKRKLRYSIDGFKPSKHPIFVKVDPYTMAVRSPAQDKGPGRAADDAAAGGEENSRSNDAFSGLYAAGPMRGDNFVRFLIGDAFAIRKHMNEEAEGTQTEMEKGPEEGAGGSCGQQ